MTALPSGQLNVLRRIFQDSGRGEGRDGFTCIIINSNIGMVFGKSAN